jgi:hypothetical protein
MEANGGIKYRVCVAEMVPLEERRISFLIYKAEGKGE